MAFGHEKRIEEYNDVERTLKNLYGLLIFETFDDNKNCFKERLGVFHNNTSTYEVDIINNKISYAGEKWEYLDIVFNIRKKYRKKYSYVKAVFLDIDVDYSIIKKIFYLYEEKRRIEINEERQVAD